MRHLVGISQLIALLSLTTYCQGQVFFEEVAEQIGIDHMHLSNEFLGGGVAIFDFNSDGLQDVYLTGGVLHDKLYKNLGNWQFEDVSVSSGIASIVDEGSFGVTTGDVDNDGYRDILVTGDRLFGSRLMRNNGNETFTEIVNAINDGEVWKSAASFGDVNQDGFLDVYIGSYVDHIGFIYDSQNQIIGFEHKCSANYLFLNNGDLSFTDVSDLYEVADTGCALAVAFSDYDFDNDPDIILANDFGEWVLPSTIFDNNGQIPLADIGEQVGMNMQIYGMGIAIGDYDRDGDLDYYQTNLGRNVLSQNQGGIFEDVTTFAHVENDSTGQDLNTGWGTFFFDANNDGWSDLFVANGEIPSAEIIGTILLDTNKLFLNNGDETFTDISESAQVASPVRSRGAAYGDLDNDGRLDFVVNNLHAWEDSANVEIYRNLTEGGNWVQLRLVGTQSNRDAFGSRARVVVNGVTTVAEVDGGSSHASQNSSVLHFGLGEEVMADSIVITFPSGIEETLLDVSANQILIVNEDLTVGIWDDASEDHFSIDYGNPNPRLNSPIEGQVNVQLIDISGKLVMENSYKVSNGLNTMFGLEELSNGVYLLSIEHEGLLQTLRLVKGLKL